MFLFLLWPSFVFCFFHRSKGEKGYRVGRERGWGGWGEKEGGEVGGWVGGGGL